MQPAPFQQDRAAPAAAQPFISVVVPVRNEARHLADTLGQLVKQDYDQERFEVLVADGRSTDGSRHIVGDFQAKHGNVYLLGRGGAIDSRLNRQERLFP